MTVSAGAIWAIMFSARQAPAFVRDYSSPANRKPPYGSVEIDLGHPLARGLIIAVLANEGGGPVTDLVSMTSATNFSPYPVWTTGAFGMGTNASGGTKFAEFPHNARQRPTTFISAVVACREVNSGATQGPFGFPYIAAAGTHFIINWGFNKVAANNNLAFVITQGGFASEAFTDIVTMTSGVDSVFGGVYDGSNVTGYRNGKQSGTPAATTGAIDSFDVGVSFSGFNEKNAGWIDNCYYGFAWNRPLSAAEFLWSYSEPFALVRQRVVRRYFTPQTTPPVVTTTPTRTLMGVGP